jgi:hypothetical protein
MATKTTTAKKATAKKEVEKPKVKPAVTAAQKKRIDAALKDKNLRQVNHDINNEFPTIRTGELLNMLLKIQRYQLFDENIIAAIENLPVPEVTEE